MTMSLNYALVISQMLSTNINAQVVAARFYEIRFGDD